MGENVPSSANDLKNLPDRFFKLGPLAWLLDHYIGLRENEKDAWINGGRPVSDEAVAAELGTTEDMIEDWRWFLAHEDLIRQQKVRGQGWIISINPSHIELLEDWLEAWRRLRDRRAALWW